MIEPVTPSLLSRITGRIAYRAPNGTEIGREFFELNEHPKGHILRALCAMDDIKLTRDVSLSMQQDWKPEEGYCRITRNGDAESAVWFRVMDHGTQADTTLHGKPQPTQFIETDNRLPYLGLHPLQGDALIAHQRGTEAEGEYHAIETVTNSISPNGDEDPRGCKMQIMAAYMGEEDVEVTAGRFRARHYALRWRDDWPPADLWVYGPKNIFLLMRWSLIPTWYELTKLHEWRAA